MDETPTTLLLVDVEVGGRAGCWVAVAGRSVAAVGTGPPPRAPGAAVVDGAGGALLPGLHDHHLHLLATAARVASVGCGPPDVTSLEGLGWALRAAAASTPAGGWVRGHGVDDAVTGGLDAAVLDRLLGPFGDRPTRLQHRSGHRWVLNTAALERVRAADPAGWAALGRPEDRSAGVFYDLDGALRARWGSETPDLAPVAATLASRGVTGLTDASVTNDAAALDQLAAAQRTGALPQRVLVLGADLPTGDDRGGATAAVPGHPGPHGADRRLATGARKIVLSERDPPPLEALVDEIRRAGDGGVAVHCVTRQDLVLATTAMATAGGGPHRIEHASVAPPELVALVAAVPACVVTQPGFVAQHGDRYRREVDPADLPWLYRLAAWRRAGVPLAAGSDAPFGDADPWRAMAAATDRRTAGGVRFGPEEALTPEEALGLFLGPLSSPGGRPRVLRPGAPADLCLLAEPWAVARRALGEVTVALTVADGRQVWPEGQGVPATVAADGTNASGGSGRPNR